jgi:hypothetical protein
MPAGFLSWWHMTAFTIHSSKDGQSTTTVRIGPTIIVAKARTLQKEGWQVYVTDASGHRYDGDEIDQLLSFDRKLPI